MALSSLGGSLSLSPSFLALAFYSMGLSQDPIDAPRPAKGASLPSPAEPFVNTVTAECYVYEQPFGAQQVVIELSLRPARDGGRFD